MTKVYFVEGNIGSGKSTFLKLLSENVEDCQVIYEPLDVWKNLKDASDKNILEYFYKDMSKYAYTFQSFAFLSRVKCFHEIDYSKKYVFIERSIYSDKNIFAKNCYNNGIMNEIEWKLYNQWFEWMEKLLNVNEESNKFIYLHCDYETSYNRLLNRHRKEEDTVSKDYLLQIYNCHESWLNSKEDLIKLDCTVNFLQDKEIFKNMIKKIDKDII